MSTSRIEQGTRIRYSLKVRGIRMKWESYIDDWSPPSRFVDVQTRGPYSEWHHTHRFKSIDAKTTEMVDEVRYRLPLGKTGERIAGRYVATDLEKIFEYRRKAIEKKLGVLI